MKETKQAKEEKEERRAMIIIFVIMGLIVIGTIVYLLISTRSGKVDTVIERKSICIDEGYEYVKWVGESYYNCCRYIYTLDDKMYKKVEECVKLEIPE